MADIVSSFDISLQQQDAYRYVVEFDKPTYESFAMDEPPPLGKDSAPSAARSLAAAVGHCLTASLMFCAARQHKLQLTGVKTRVHVDIVRNENRRLRVGGIRVVIDPGTSEEASLAILRACDEAFEDFCTVTQSVRKGINVEVKVKGVDEGA